MRYVRWSFVDFLPKTKSLIPSTAVTQASERNRMWSEWTALTQITVNSDQLRFVYITLVRTPINIYIIFLFQYLHTFSTYTYLSLCLLLFQNFYVQSHANLSSSTTCFSNQMPINLTVAFVTLYLTYAYSYFIKFIHSSYDFIQETYALLLWKLNIT